MPKANHDTSSTAKRALALLQTMAVAATKREHHQCDGVTRVCMYCDPNDPELVDGGFPELRDAGIAPWGEDGDLFDEGPAADDGYLADDGLADDSHYRHALEVVADMLRGGDIEGAQRHIAEVLRPSPPRSATHTEVA